MRSIDLNPRRIEGLRSRVFGTRSTIQVVVGAFAIAAIVLAFLFRPGQTSEEPKVASTPVPSAAAAAATATAPPPSAAAKQPTLAPTAAPAPAKERVHTVASGDTLMSIATKYYNDASKYEKIFEANKDVLKDPNVLQVGQNLKIPD